MVNTLEKIYKLSLKLLIPLDLEETYKFIVKEGMKLIKADHGSILLLEEGKLKRVYVSSPMFYKIKPRRGDFMYRVIETQKPMVLDVEQLAKRHPEIRETKIQSDIILPLSNHKRPFGVLTFMSLKDKTFTEKEINSLKLFAPLAMMAIRKAQLYDETRKALEARDLFISMAAHELRTPLTTINGYIQLLYSKLGGADTSESRWIEELTWEGYRLTQLINELLEVNRIKTGHLRYIWTECSLVEVVNQALKDFSFTHPENTVVLENKSRNGRDRIIGDYNKLLQVIINLLDNAAQSSSPDKRIFITLIRKAGFVVLAIKDEGKGISKKDLPMIYEMFYRGENHTKEGIGIGLFLAKHIISQHRGTINIKSELNKGTTVEVKLPASKM